MLCLYTVVSSEESEQKEYEDGEDSRKRYDFRQRKTVERYQAPLESRLCAQFLSRANFLHISENFFLMKIYTHIQLLFKFLTFILQINFIKCIYPVHVIFLCHLAYLLLFFCKIMIYVSLKE